MGTLLDKANNILAEKMAKIIPENIKGGVVVYDVNGTYTGPRPTMYRYNTILEMNASQNHENGDIAIISSIEQQQFQRDSQVSYVNCPRNVTLTEPVTQSGDESIQWGLQPVDNTHWDIYQGGGVLNRNFFTFDIMWSDEQGEHSIGVTYTSNDGINYTIGGSGSDMITKTFPEEFEFGRGNDSTPITWDDRISQFLYIGGDQEVINLYKYTNNVWTALGKWAS